MWIARTTKEKWPGMNGVRPKEGMVLITGSLMEHTIAIYVRFTGIKIRKGMSFIM